MKLRATCMSYGQLFLLIAILYTAMNSYAGKLLSLPETTLSEGLSVNEITLLKEKTFPKRVPLVRQSILLKIDRVQTEINNENYRKAEEHLKKFLGKPEKLRSYERAQLYNMLAYLSYLDLNYIQSIHAYELLIQEDELIPTLYTDALYALAQINYHFEHLDRSLDYLQIWFHKNTTPHEAAYELISQLYYRQGAYQEGIDSISQAIALTEQHNKKPKESWYQLKWTMHHELGQTEDVISVLRILIHEFPKKNYWLQLSSVYGLMGDSTLRLNVLDLAYTQNFLDTENEHLALAQLYLQADVPYKAALLLDKGLNKGVINDNSEHRTLLANAWILSQESENSIIEMKKAASFAYSGDLLFQLGQIYLNSDNYDDAQESFEKALTKKKVDRVDRVYAMLGITYIKLKQWDKATSAFAKARKDPRSIELIAPWEAFLAQKKQ